jgi:hypothetical protein
MQGVSLRLYACVKAEANFTLCTLRLKVHGSYIVEGFYWKMPTLFLNISKVCMYLWRPKLSSQVKIS